jgi:hypothetical protein
VREQDGVLGGDAAGDVVRPVVGRAVDKGDLRLKLDVDLGDFLLEGDIRFDLVVLVAEKAFLVAEPLRKGELVLLALLLAPNRVAPARVVLDGRP